MKNFNWIKEVPNHLEFFTQDQQMIINLIGLDNYLKLHDYFGKTSIYFSEEPINSLKKAWVIKNKHVSYSEAARKLDISVKTIYNWRGEASIDNLDLFTEDKK